MVVVVEVEVDVDVDVDVVVDVVPDGLLVVVEVVVVVVVVVVHGDSPLFMYYHSHYRLKYAATQVQNQGEATKTSPLFIYFGSYPLLFSKSAAIMRFMASMPTLIAPEVSSVMGIARPAFSRSWFQTAWKQLPQRTPSAAATTNSAADSISLDLTPSRFQLSHFCSRS